MVIVLTWLATPLPSLAVAYLQNTRALPFLHIVSNPEATVQQGCLDGWVEVKNMGGKV